MRAIAFEELGGPEVLRLVTLERPEPGPGEVLIEVAYAGVNYAEIQHRLGDFGAPDGWTVPGLEAAGRIAALGAEVSDLAVGDAVTAFLPDGGGYAEYVSAPATTVWPIGDLDARVAAGFPCVLPTAYGLVVGAGRIAPGETVLIHAAAGGVGSAAVQVARALGAGAIYGTVGGADKVEYAKDLGYDAVFLRDGFVDDVRAATGGRGVDVVLDPVGGPTRAASVELLAPFGRLAAFGDAAREPDLSYAFLDLWKHNRSIGGYNIGDLARRAPAVLGEHAAAALDLVRDGRVRVDITAELPLADAAEAHRVMAAGANRGKTILRVA